MTDSDYSIPVQNPEPVKMSSSRKENPEERLKWEWSRLRDPSTNRIPLEIRKKELAYAEQLPKRDERTMVLGKGEAAISTWTQRGPYNVGGRTRALALDISDGTENTLLAGGVSGGMWKTTDGGSNWTKVTSVSDLHSVTCIVQDTRAGEQSTWYYGTGEYRGNSAGSPGAWFGGDGIFKSTDGGDTWTILTSTQASSSPTPQTNSTFDYIWDIAIDPSNAGQDEVYAATWLGIYRSLDGGSNWTKVLDTGYYADVHVTATGVLYATSSSDGTIKGVHKSADNGNNWTDITPALNAGYKRIVIDVAPSDENTAYILAHTDGDGGIETELWSTANAGTNWTDRSANLPSGAGKTEDFDTQESYNMLISVKPDNASVVFIGGISLYRSNDGFATNGHVHIGGYAGTDTYAIYSNHHPDVHAQVFLPSDPTIMYSGTDGGVHKTTNNMAGTVTWSSLNNGYLTTQFYTVAIDQSAASDDIILGGMQDNGTYFVNSTSASANWASVFSGDGAYIGIADNKSYYYLSSQNGNVLRFVINTSGVTGEWTKVDPSGGSGYLFINPFVLDPANTDMMYIAAGEYVWRNSDLTGIPAYDGNAATENWTQLTNSRINGETISALGIAETSRRLYYGTTTGTLKRLDGVESGDPVPTDITSGSFPANSYIGCIAVDPSDEDKAAVVFTNYSIKSVFYTDDAGATWTDVSGNLEENADGSGNGPSVRWIEIMPRDVVTVYLVATSTGLYSTTELNGTSTTWSQEGAGTIGNVVVDMIDSRQSDGIVAVGTHGAGIYSSTITSSLFTPAKPTGLAGSQSGGDVILTWNANSESDLANYTVYRKTNSSGVTASNEIGTVAAGTTTYTDSTVVGGNTYYYRISADKSGSNKSELSDEISIAVQAGLSLGSISNITKSEGETVTLTLSSSYYGSDNLLYSMSSDIPDTANFSLNSSTGEFSWATDFESAGTYTLQFTVSDGSLTDSKTITVTITDYDYITNGTFNPDTTAVTDSGGGTVTVAPGGLYTQHSVNIPPNTLGSDENVIVLPPATSYLPADQYTDVPSAINFLVEGSEAGFTFQDSVEITLEYKDFEIDESESRMKVHLWDNTNQIWRRVMSDQALDTGNNTLTLKVMHFSVYGVLEVADTTSLATIGAGWSMIGIPLEIDGSNDPVSVFGDDINPFVTDTQNSNIYEYDELNQAWSVPSTVEYTNGYILYGWENDSYANISGLEITGDFTKTLSYTNSNGWHLIGNPYAETISWGTDVVAGAGVDNIFYYWDGTQYVYYPGGGLSSPDISAWQGVWVHTTQANSTLSFTYPGPSSPKRAAPELDLVSRIRISAESGSLIDTHNYIGMSGNAPEVYGAYELVPLSTEFLSVYFQSGEEKFTQDIRPVEDYLVFSMVVATNSSAGSVKLNWEIPNEFSGYDILISDDSGNSLDMRSNSELSFISGPGLHKVSREMNTPLVDPTDFLGKTSAESLSEHRFTIILSKRAVGIDDNSTTPEEFYLKQNYPNPFNPETTIEYGLPVSGQVKVTIFNMLGQEIETLTNQVQSAGIHSVKWNGTNNTGRPVASGLYLYRIESGTFIKSRKLLLLR